MKGRILGGLVLTVLLFLWALTGYAETEVNMGIVSGLDDRIVTIEGAADAACPYVLMIVYKPGKGESDITAETDSGVISRIETIAVSDDGSFRMEFEMEDEESGVYSAYFKAGTETWIKTFPYTSKARLGEALEKINSIDANTQDEELKSIYGTYCGDLRLPDKWFSALPASKQTEILESVFKSGTEYKSGGAVRGIMAEAVCTACANGGVGAAALQEMLAVYEDTLQFEGNSKLFGVYVVSQEQRVKICKDVIASGAYQTIESVREAYQKSALLRAVNDVSEHGAMQSLLNAYASGFGGISFADYNRLTNLKKKSVDTRMIQTEFEKIEEVKTAFDKYVSEAADAGNSGGGGSGGGASSARPSVSFDKETPEKSGEQTSFDPETAVIFKDIDHVAWARRAIETLYRLGIIKGKSEGVFEPEAQVTRGEFVKMLCTAMGLKETANMTVQYTDVPADDWCRSYIAAATQNGLVQGNPDGSFGKDEPILRQDIAVILYRALVKAGMSWGGDEAEQFADADQIDDYALESAVRLRQAGIIDGVGENRFAPKANASRAEAAKMIYMFYSIINSL